MRVETVSLRATVPNSEQIRAALLDKACLKCSLSPFPTLVNNHIAYLITVVSRDLFVTNAALLLKEKIA